MSNLYPARAGSRALRAASGLRLAMGAIRSSSLASSSSQPPSSRVAAAPAVPRLSSFFFSYSFSTSLPRRGITPDNEPTEGAQTIDLPATPITPAEISEQEYHAEADEFLERLVQHLERLQDEREEMDVEFAAGVLTVSFGDDIGTYVINKQPPNKQIWLSSPKTGPKRYDLVVLGDGQHEKQDTARCEWMYLRDRSTMNDLFKEELGIDLKLPPGQYGGGL